MGQETSQAFGVKAMDCRRTGRSGALRSMPCISCFSLTDLLPEKKCDALCNLIFRPTPRLLSGCGTGHLSGPSRDQSRDVGMQAAHPWEGRSIQRFLPQRRRAEPRTDLRSGQALDRRFCQVASRYGADGSNMARHHDSTAHTISGSSSTSAIPSCPREAADQGRMPFPCRYPDEKSRDRRKAPGFSSNIISGTRTRIPDRPTHAARTAVRPQGHRGNGERQSLAASASRSHAPASIQPGDLPFVATTLARGLEQYGRLLRAACRSSQGWLR